MEYLTAFFWLEGLFATDERDSVQRSADRRDSVQRTEEIAFSGQRSADGRAKRQCTSIAFSGQM
ncbi:MAG: hypothetical protein WC644_06910 [Ignavibacteria bacterium]